MVSIGDLFLNRSVVASIGKDPLNMAIKAKDLGADLLELRIDLMEEDPRNVLKELRNLNIPIIITNRMKEEGGAWDRSEDERLDLLISLMPLADAVDIELCANKRDDIINKARDAGKTAIVSTHDFEKTPDNDVMMGIIHEAMEAGADIAKIAVMPESYNDVLRLLEVTLHADMPVCMIAMGGLGKHSRVIAPVYGSVMTYGFVEKSIAPGQLKVDELKYIINKLF